MTRRLSDPLTQRRKYDPTEDPWLGLGIMPEIRNDAQRYTPVTVTLPTELVEELDNIRIEHRWDFPELFAYRATFVEGAILYFINTLKERELINGD